MFWSFCGKWLIKNYAMLVFFVHPGFEQDGGSQAVKKLPGASFLVRGSNPFGYVLNKSLDLILKRSQSLNITPAPILGGIIPCSIFVRLAMPIPISPAISFYLNRSLASDF